MSLTPSSKHAPPVFSSHPFKAQHPASRTRNSGPAFTGSTLTPGMAQNRVSGALKALDFKEMGVSHLAQIKLIYGLCILSRFYNAARRSKNELRETVTRDTMGYTFWFFATPLIQRLFLRFFPSRKLKDLRPMLIRGAPRPLVTNGLVGKLKLLNWKLNPLSFWQIPSTQQLRDQRDQVLKDFGDTLRTQAIAAGKEPLTELEISRNHAYQKLANYYNKGLLRWRYFATGLGWLFTIGLLGIGISMYNIHLTKKKVAEARAAQMTPNNV